MAITLDASINVLWQNLIALNTSLFEENEQRKKELTQTKMLLQKEIETSKVLQAKHKIQEHELLKKNQKIARLSSKMVAVRQIISHDSDDDCIENGPMSTVPVIVKVESIESNADTVPEDDKNFLTNLCPVCGKKLGSRSSLKGHMVLHSAPTIRCPICSSKFFRSDYLQRHIQKVHRSGTRSRPSLKKI